MTQVVGVHIHSYRGVSDVMMPLGRTTVLVGANGAGKSSLLEAMGLIPSEEGAAGRRFDAPPIVDWFIEPDDRTEMRAALLEALPAQIGDQVLKVLDPQLVVRLGWDGTSTLAVNLQSALNTVRSIDATKWRRRLEQVCSSPLAPSWVTEISQSAAAAPHERRSFIDLGLPVTLPIGAGPSVVSMWAEPDDISPMLYRHVNRILHAWCEPLGDGDLDEVLVAFSQGRLHSAHQRGLLTPVLSSLSELATGMLLVPFVARLGSVEVQLLAGPDSALGEVERLIAAAIRDDLNGYVPDSLARAQSLLRRFGDSEDLHFEVAMRPGGHSSGSALDYSRLGTGIRRWVSGAVDEAARLLCAGISHSAVTDEERRRWLRDSALPPAKWLKAHAEEQRRKVPTIRLIDEPLANLEPRVHRDVVGWMRDRLAEGERLVLSTHNAAALAASRPSDPVTVIGVHREAGMVKVQPLGRRLNEELLKAGKRLGVSGPELLFTTRAMLLVEGPHDVALLRASCGRQLAERGVVFSIISGSSHAALSAALSSDLQQMVQLPVWLILDSTKDDRLKASERFVHRGQSDKTLREMIDELQQRGVSNVHHVPFEPADVLAGIKPSLLRAAFPGGSVPDDDVAFEQLRAAEKSSDVKHIVLEWCKQGSLQPKVATVVSRVTAQARQSGVSVGNVWLNSTVSQLLADLDQRLK